MHKVNHVKPVKPSTLQRAAAAIVLASAAGASHAATNGFDPSDAVAAINGSTVGIIAIATAVIGVLAVIFGINKSKTVVK
jgi:hypothetical protein